MAVLRCHGSACPVGSFRAMLSTRQQTALAAADCEVRFDNLTRQLYATDASIYQIEPLGVAFPASDAAQAAAVIRRRRRRGRPRHPARRRQRPGRAARSATAWSSTSRGTTGRSPTSIWTNARVRVGAGVVLDQLNAFLKPARLLLRAGCGHQFARHAGRHDRQQFLRRARARVRHHRRPRRRARIGAGGRPGEDRGPARRSLGPAARTGRAAGPPARRRDRRRACRRICQTLAGLRLDRACANRTI